MCSAREADLSADQQPALPPATNNVSRCTHAYFCLCLLRRLPPGFASALLRFSGGHKSPSDWAGHAQPYTPSHPTLLDRSLRSIPVNVLPYARRFGQFPRRRYVRRRTDQRKVGPPENGPCPCSAPPPRSFHQLPMVVSVSSHPSTPSAPSCRPVPIRRPLFRGAFGRRRFASAALPAATPACPTRVWAIYK